jgi:hypothetical protein
VSVVILRNCLIPECGGADHKWEFERPTLRELRRIQEVIGLDPEQFEEAVNEGAATIASIDAILILVAILHKRIGVIVPFDDVDVDITGLQFMPDPEAEPEGKPTGPPPTSPPPEDPAAASASGDSTAEGSEPRSSTSEPDSGGSTASPSTPSTT